MEVSDEHQLLNMEVELTIKQEQTIPILPSPHGETLLERVHERYGILHQALRKNLHVVEIQFAYQPITPHIAQQTASRSRYVLAIDSKVKGHIFIEMGVFYLGTKPSPRISALLQRFRDDVTKITAEEYGNYKVAATQANPQSRIAEFSELYLPYFANDAGQFQNVTGAYSNFAELSTIQKAVDPEGFFATRTGGWKFN
jgi:hypothetical protein